jgi:hypothetical protein
MKKPKFNPNPDLLDDSDRKKMKSYLLPVNHFNFILLIMLIDVIVFFVVVAILPPCGNVLLAFMTIIALDTWMINRHLGRCNEHDS